MKKEDLPRVIAITVTCVILGFVLALQLRSMKIITTTGASGSARAEQLQTELSQEKTKNEELREQLLQLKGEVDKYRSISQESGNISQVLTEQLGNAENLAGLTDVVGPGVIVTMRDATDRDPNRASENYTIHDGNIRDIINELLASGAEAISVNGERVIATTSIRCVGPTVTINNTRYAEPYIIRAIGDPKTLEAGLLIKGGLVEVLRSWNNIVDVQTSDKIEIDAYKGMTVFEHLKPKAAGGAE